MLWNLFSNVYEISQLELKGTKPCPSIRPTRVPTFDYQPNCVLKSHTIQIQFGRTKWKNIKNKGRFKLLPKNQCIRQFKHVWIGILWGSGWWDKAKGPRQRPASNTHYWEKWGRRGNSVQFWTFKPTHSILSLLLDQVRSNYQSRITSPVSVVHLLKSLVRGIRWKESLI